MPVPYTECVAHNCVVCLAWAPPRSRRLKLARGWSAHLQPADADTGERSVDSGAFALDKEAVVEGIDTDEEANVELVTLPDEVVGLMMHCMGHNEANLVHQLEAKALKPESMLTQEEWLALTPYMMIDESGDVSYENRGLLEGRIDQDTTRFFLEIWHGYYGIKNALNLRLRARRIHTSQDSFIPANERRALGFLHETLKANAHRIHVLDDGIIALRGDSGLHWHIEPNVFGAVPSVRCRETKGTYCIQLVRSEIECPAADYTALYVLAMLNDLETSMRVSTLSDGLKREQKAKSGVSISGLPSFDERGESFQRVFS